jgi:hypothetical protein
MRTRQFVLVALDEAGRPVVVPPISAQNHTGKEGISQ